MKIKKIIIIFLIIMFIIIGKRFDAKTRSQAKYNAIINAERYETERQLEVYGRIY